MQEKVIIFVCITKEARIDEGRRNARIILFMVFLIIFFYSIRAMAALARTAIENEQKIQQQLTLEDKDFVVDWVSRQITRFSGCVQFFLDSACRHTLLATALLLHFLLLTQQQHFF